MYGGPSIDTLTFSTPFRRRPSVDTLTFSTPVRRRPSVDTLTFHAPPLQFQHRGSFDSPFNSESKRFRVPDPPRGSPSDSKSKKFLPPPPAPFRRRPSIDTLTFSTPVRRRPSVDTLTFSRLPISTPVRRHPSVDTLTFSRLPISTPFRRRPSVDTLTFHAPPRFRHMGSFDSPFNSESKRFWVPDPPLDFDTWAHSIPRPILSRKIFCPPPSVEARPSTL